MNPANRGSSDFIPLGQNEDRGDDGTRPGPRRWWDHSRGRGGRGRWGNMRPGFGAGASHHQDQERSRGRGVFGPGRGPGPGSYKPREQHFAKRGHGSNFGSTDDISLYYHPSMVQDPWRDLECLLNPSSSSCKQHSESKNEDLQSNLDSSDNEVSMTGDLASERDFQRQSEEVDSHSLESDGSVTP